MSKVYQKDNEIEEILKSHGTSIKECEEIAEFNIYMLKEDDCGNIDLVGWDNNSPRRLELRKAIAMIQKKTHRRYL